MEKPDPIMTINEAAEYLDVHPMTLRRLARHGQVPAFKTGRQWRIKRAILDRWLEREAMQNVGVSLEQE